VLPAKSKKPLDLAPKFQGFVDERSVHHVAGWVRDRFNQSERVIVEAVLITTAGEQSLGKAKAESFYPPLAQQSIGDGCYGFQLFFPAPVTEVERDAVIVRPVGTPAVLELSPNLRTSFELLSFVAMDIVNNCNLRCPFCLFDYKDTKSTKFMSDETFDAALRLIPHAGDGNFWLSCLHEPSLHPDFLRLIERIPRQWRRKVMFTTNLAKRMPESYFESLAASGVHHINVSVESLVPEIFERMRKGARFRIFKENWDRMIAAWKAAANPPRLRYIMMAYQSNKAEIPGLVTYLREERCAAEVEIRYTYDMEHIPADFRTAEYLLDADWDWLANQLAMYPADEVLLTPPVKPLGDEPQQGMVSVTADQLAEYLAENAETTPAAAAAAGAAPSTPVAPGPEATAPTESQPAPQTVLAGAENHAINLPLNVQVEWDGKLVICGKWDHPSERRLAAVVNINDLSDPYYYLVKLPSRPKIQGFVDELSPTAVTGWVRNLLDPKDRISIEAVLIESGETRVIARGRADQLYKPLLDSPFGDARYGFTLSFPQPLTAAECENLQVRPSHDTIPLDRSPRYQGYVDERSPRHVRGWVRNRFDPAERVTVEAVVITPAGEEILWTGRADRFDEHIAKHAVGDARYGFRFEFNPPLTEAERQSLIIRPAGDPTPVELSPRLVSTFIPDSLTPA
jgi:organic radical activating enzyme